MLFPKDKTIHELLPQQITDGYTDKPYCKKMFFIQQSLYIQIQIGILVSF